jgi:hypothetical protein
MPSALFHLKDLELNHTLKRKLRAWTRQGKSTRDIAALLSQSGAKVQRTAVREWQKQLGIGGKRAK